MAKAAQSKMKSLLKSCSSSLKTLFKYRFHSIPFIIFILFGVMIGVSLVNGPSHYREKMIFHISNLGNWQEGVGFFSFFMTSIAILMFVLFQEVNRNRTDILVSRTADGTQTRGTCDKHWYFSWLPELHSISSMVFMMGLILAGCFQQSFNKPWHTTGFLSMTFGFGFVVVCDFVHYARCCCCEIEDRCGYSGDRFLQTKRHKIAFILRIILSAIIVIAGATFFGFNMVAKNKWTDGEESALENLVEKGTLETAECPVWSVDIMMSNETCQYPYYYPCKSGTLWTKDDPGWEEFKISAILEFVLFIAVILYSFTYIAGDLKPRPLIPRRSEGDCSGHEQLQNVDGHDDAQPDEENTSI